MRYEELIPRLSDVPKDPDELFRLMRSVSYFYSAPDTDRFQGVEAVVRLISKRRDIEERLKGAGAMLDALAREAGLFPYVRHPATWHDEYARTIMAAPGMKDVYFHIEQASVFAELASGTSLILSAPTSFGKSLLVDSLIALKRPKTVVACVPTIALLDEFRRRMKRRFTNYQIITSATQERVRRKAIYIGTQERLRERNDLEKVDLFVLDEFYKLDLSRGDERSLTLNALLSSIGRAARQIYLLGPSIDEVPESQAFRQDVKFVKTRYSPVAADIIDRSGEGPNLDALLRDLRIEDKSSCLVYVKSPPASWKLTYALLKRTKFRSSSFLADFGNWLGSHYHPEWVLAKSLAKGIGVHHGRLPRSVAHIMVDVFNRGELTKLLCTSSMIEGVNTAAECVFVYDRHINQKKIDRFTFDNIKGRAGRLLKHAIGRIYLYNLPPEATTYNVDVPIFGEQSRYSDELLFAVEERYLSRESLRRKQALVDTSLLPDSVISAWSEFGVDALDALAEIYLDADRSRGSMLLWRGYPDFGQLEHTLNVAWSVLRFAKHGLFSGRQAAHFSNVLRRNKELRGYFEELVKGRGEAAQGDIDTCMNFLRGAEYTFPQVLRCMNDVADAVLQRNRVDYRVYAQALQNYFLPEGIRTLDEFGIPIPMGMKLAIDRDANATDPDRLIQDIQSRAQPRLSSLERRLLDLGIG